MSPSKQNQTSRPAVSGDPSALALSSQDELAEMFGDEDLGVTGLEGTDASDVKMSSLVFNFNGVDEDGDPIPKNTFFDTVTEETRKKVRLALLTVHKSNAWTEFVEGQGNQVRCRSWDRVTGEMEDGSARPCAGCPDKKWARDPDTGKRNRNCADVHNVIGIDLEDSQPKMLRFKRSSERPWSDYLNRYFLKRRIVNGRRADVPLYAYPTEITLEMISGKSGSYAKPKFERGELFAREDIVALAEHCRGAKEWLDVARALADAADAQEGGETAAASPSYDEGDFSDDGTDDFS